MAQQMQQQPQIQYVDRPDVCETFVDSSSQVTFDGQTLRLTLCVTRMDPPNPNLPPSGKQYAACRLVMPPGGLMGLAATLNQVVAELKKQGIIKDMPFVMPEPGGKPN